MNRHLAYALIVIMLVLAGCGEWSTRPMTEPPDTLRTPPPTPMYLTGGSVVIAGQAKGYLDKRAAFFLDVRHALEYRDGRIPGAVSMPMTGPVGYSEDFHPERRNFAIFQLRFDKSTRIIVYGEDTKDWRAYHASRVLIERGHDNVMWFRGGYEDWVRRGYGVER